MADKMEERSHDSAEMLGYWELSDDLVGGIEEIREKGEKYLPRFPAEGKEEFRFRLNHTTVMTNIFADVIETLASKPFEKPTELVGDNIPLEIIDFSNDVDGSGNNLSVFAANFFYGAIKSGLNWLFIDYPTADPNITTAADLKAAGLRPFWTVILAENVLEVRSQFIKSKEVLTYVRIQEPGKPKRVRVMERDPATGEIGWSLYVKTEKYNEVEKTFYVLEDSGFMRIDEIPMVPLFTGRREGKSFEFDPPLKAAAELQLHLYRQESGLNYVTTLTAYPMLSANGVKPERNADGSIKPIATGPNAVLYAPPGPDGTVGNWKYVEPQANSLEFLKKYCETITLNLRELGRQPLTATSSNLTTVTTAFAAGKSKSAVKAWGLLLKDALENAYRITAKWFVIDYAATVSVYLEFDDFVDGKDYDSLRAARDKGDISQETYWEELKRRGLLSSEFTVERERERLLKELPGDGPDNDPAL